MFLDLGLDSLVDKFDRVTGAVLVEILKNW